MIEDYIRPTLQRYTFDPIARLLNNLSIKPNHITLLSIVLGLLSPIAFILHHNFFGIILLLVSGLCDVLDGSLARVSSQSSNLGATLDIVGDRIVEFAIMASFYFYSPTRNALGVIAMLGASYLCVTTFLIVGMFTQNDSQKSFHYSAGLIERPEAFGFFIIMMLFPASFAWLSWGYFVLVLYTASTRMLAFYQHNRMEHLA